MIKEEEFVSIIHPSPQIVNQFHKRAIDNPHTCVDKNDNHANRCIDKANTLANLFRSFISRNTLLISMPIFIHHEDDEKNDLIKMQFVIIPHLQKCTHSQCMKWRRIELPEG